MKRAEVIASVILFLVGIGFTYQSTKLSYSHLYAPGPGFLPFWIGILLVVLSVALLMFLFQSRVTDKTIWPNREMAFKLFSIIMALFFYLLAMAYLGYAISTVVFCACLIKILSSRRPWTESLVIANMVTIPIVAVFDVWFGVPLPKGLFQGFGISMILVFLVILSIVLILYRRFRKGFGKLTHNKGS